MGGVGRALEEAGEAAGEGGQGGEVEAVVLDDGGKGTRVAEGEPVEPALRDCGAVDVAVARAAQDFGLEARERAVLEAAAPDAARGMEEVEVGKRSEGAAVEDETGFEEGDVEAQVGDIDSARLRGLADLTRRYACGEARITNEQNFILRYVAGQDLPALQKELDALGLAAPNANSVFDITSCPGTTTCGLGITNSKGLGEAIIAYLERNRAQFASVPGLRIKISGCPNSCGQHHIVPIGLYGCTRSVNGRDMPHALLLWGGALGPFARIGQIAIKLPAKRVPEAVSRLVELWREERKDSEDFSAFSRRVDKSRVKEALADLVATENADESLFHDHGEDKPFSAAAAGLGECSR